LYENEYLFQSQVSKFLLFSTNIMVRAKLRSKCQPFSYCANSYLKKDL
jgi:hypothetical protein